MKLNIIKNIFLFILATIAAILLVFWFSWIYYSEYRKDEIKEYLDFINTIEDLSKFPELLDDYKDDAEEIMAAFNNIVNPFGRERINAIKTSFINRGNFDAPIQAAKESGKAVAGSRTAYHKEYFEWVKSVLMPYVNWYQRMRRDWHNFWTGNFSAMNEGNENFRPGFW